MPNQPNQIASLEGVSDKPPFKMPIYLRYFLWIFIPLLLFFGFSLTILYLFQRKILYIPGAPDDDRHKDSEMSRLKLQVVVEEFLKLGPSTKLNYYWIPYAGNHAGLLAKKTVIMNHGNAGSIVSRLEIAKSLMEALSANVLLCSYPGYGKSTGDSPSQETFQKYAIAVFELAIQYEPSLPIVFYGQSLGGAVVTYAVTEIAFQTAASKKFANYWTKIGGLIIENTFLSIPEFVKSKIPCGKLISLFIRDRWDSEKRLNQLFEFIKKNDLKVEFPILLLSAENDDLIPPEHMDKLYKIFSKFASNLKMVKFPNAHHNDTCGASDYFTSISNHMNK